MDTKCQRDYSFNVAYRFTNCYWNTKYFNRQRPNTSGCQNYTYYIIFFILKRIILQSIHKFRTISNFFRVKNNDDSCSNISC